MLNLPAGTLYQWLENVLLPGFGAEVIVITVEMGVC